MVAWCDREDDALVGEVPTRRNNSGSRSDAREERRRMCTVEANEDLMRLRAGGATGETR